MSNKVLLMNIWRRHEFLLHKITSQETDSRGASALTRLRSPPTVNLLAYCTDLQDLTNSCHCHTSISTRRWQAERLRWWHMSLLVSVCLTSLVGLEVGESAEVRGVPCPERHTTPPSDLRTWSRNPVRDPLLWLSSCPPPFSTSCVGSGTRSWCVSRWGWGWARAPRGAGGRCTCWRETLSRARAAALWCTPSACACSPRPPPCKDLKQNNSSGILVRSCFRHRHTICFWGYYSLKVIWTVYQGVI